MEDREMYDEINALIGAAAKALDTSEMEVITAIEQGRLDTEDVVEKCPRGDAMEMLTDDKGMNYVSVTMDGREARIYQGAIFRADDRPDADDDEDCGGGGCSCGH